MNNKQDYYDVLGLNKNASQEEIKKAYRRLAKKFHPDVSKEKDAEIKFKEIGEAYEVLSNINKKQRYDQFGHAGVNPQAAASGGFDEFDSSAKGFGNNFSGFSSGFDDIFEQFFGGSERNKKTSSRSFNNQSIKGDNISANINISLKEMMFGVTVSLNLTLNKACEICNKTGAKNPKKDIYMCTTCNGKGYINYKQHSLFGVIQVQKQCPDCKGIGKVIMHKCPNCRGNGHYIGKEKIEVEIPKSILPNQQLKIREKGHYGVNDGPRGDIYLDIKVKENKHYKRINNDLYLDLSVNYLDALLGGEIIVPTFDGNIKLKLPVNTKAYSIFNISNYGFYKSSISNKRGDLIIRVIITVPTKLSLAEKTKLNELKEISDFKINLNEFTEGL